MRTELASFIASPPPHPPPPRTPRAPLLALTGAAIAGAFRFGVAQT